ncbi:hypothetical protein G6F56_007032 [Rhizopus delemar]|nr:hypothetical protein G6F56_007032 [Rhizopus delemar]
MNNERSTKRQRSKDSAERETDLIIEALGIFILNIQGDIRRKQAETYIPSAAVNFLLQNTAHEDHNKEIYNDTYCLITGFITAYSTFIEIILSDSFNQFMQLFSVHDSLLNTPFLWYFYENRMTLRHRLRMHLGNLDISTSSIDDILSGFYTLHFLEISAQKHQKDHGQYYTPKAVIRFMWGKVIATNAFSLNGALPKILDPCLGIGSFLCEYINLLIEKSRVTIWDDSDRLAKLLTQDIPETIWGVEIDPFAYILCKLNMMVHLFPIYQRLIELHLSLAPGSINRLRLFCNDTLTLRLDTQDTFERNCSNLLRDPTRLKFHFIVTNPPYMIRRTGFVTQPDPTLYDQQILSGRGTQAYIYFMWIALQRIDDQKGQLCLITPSQWTILEFAQYLRKWMLLHCKVLDMYEFEPYKVWPKLQTDSLIFRICKRSATLFSKNYTLYLRYKIRITSLADILEQFNAFDPAKPQNPCIQYRYGFFLRNCRDITSFNFILPTASCLDELNRITGHLPRLCDGEGGGWYSRQVPLVWHRGPNTNPVYALVVRTSWAKLTFGERVCQLWLKPCFYWNGKTDKTCAGKEVKFWKSKDPLRLSKKETSAAEAYWPYHSQDAIYSIIMVNKEDADFLKTQTDDQDCLILYNYLREARLQLQPSQNEKEIIYCQYNKSGADQSIKIIHPINCGYYSCTQPRQRFFVDTTQIAVTNQCIYFTIDPDSPWQDYDYFCGLLNCTLLQYFIKIYCSYDQQGRMRFFSRSMASLPFALPPSFRFMQDLSLFVQSATFTRIWLYTFVRYANDGQKLMECIRSYDWHLGEKERAILNEYDLIYCKYAIQTDANLAGFSYCQSISWIDSFAKKKSGGALHVFASLLKISSLFQFAIDQMAYNAYKIPVNLQQEMENELKLKNLSREWMTKVGSEYNEKWREIVMIMAKSILCVG